MASSYTSLALGALLLMSCVSWGTATVYTVGNSQGWGFSVNYSTWASGKKFAVGDKLVFNYQSGQHTVTEVSSSDYNSCSASNPISSTSTGPTTITLTTAGSHYYICAITGHCSAGMKLAVNVANPSSSPSTQPPKSSSPAPLATPSSSPSTQPPKSASPAPLATPSTSPSTPPPKSASPAPLATPTTPSISTSTPTAPSTSTAAAPSTPTASAPANSQSGAATGLLPTVSAVAAIAGLVAMLF